MDAATVMLPTGCALHFEASTFTFWSTKWSHKWPCLNKRFCTTQQTVLFGSQQLIYYYCLFIFV